MSTNNQIITIYTAGFSTQNDTLSMNGGWAAVLEDKERQLRIAGYETGANYARMRLQAMVMGLGAVKRDGVAVRLWTNAEFARGGFSEWLPIWKANGWKILSTNQPPKHADLWQEIDAHKQRLNVSAEWLKAHDRQLMNVLVNALARETLFRRINVRERRKARDVSMGSK